MLFADILDDAMYSGSKLKITTKERGQIAGIPHSVDEFEADEERLGYRIEIDEHTLMTVFLDEIIEVNTISEKTEVFIPRGVKLASGK